MYTKISKRSTYNILFCSNYTFRYSYLVSALPQSRIHILELQCTASCRYCELNIILTFNWIHSWGVLGKKYTLGFTIHRGALFHDYFQIRIHEDELQSSILTNETVWGLAMTFVVASLCQSDCNTLTALSIMFMVICSHPFLPPLFPRQCLTRDHSSLPGGVPTKDRGCARSRT